MIFNRLKEPVFIKTNSDLENKIKSLNHMKNNGVNNSYLDSQLLTTTLGLEGEKQIEYELSTAPFGMYILHDILLTYKDLTCQIDYIVITPAKIYYIECKNLIGNITINENGDFVRSYYNGKKMVVEGMYSPLRQSKRHLDLVHKRWSLNNKGLFSGIREKNFNKWNKAICVIANKKSIVNDKFAPKDIKKDVIKIDRLIDYLKRDIDNTEAEELMSDKTMKSWADAFLEAHNSCIKINNENNISNDYRSNDELRGILMDFRKDRSKLLNVPTYYVFNNSEMEDLLVIRPKSIDDLYDYKLLSEIKIKKHGKEIIDIINS